MPNVDIGDKQNKQTNIVHRMKPLLRTT